MGHPTEAKITDRLLVAVAEAGRPLWTRIEVNPGDSQRRAVALLNEEQARELHFRLSRIVAFLDKEDEDDAVRARADAMRRANSTPNR